MRGLGPVYWPSMKRHDRQRAADRGRGLHRRVPFLVSVLAVASAARLPAAVVGDAASPGGTAPEAAAGSPPSLPAGSPPSLPAGSPPSLPAVPPQPVSVSVRVDPRHPGTAIPPRYLGLSFEASDLASVAGYGRRGDLVAFLRSLGPGLLRFGGVSADTRVGWADAATAKPG